MMVPSVGPSMVRGGVSSPPARYDSRPYPHTAASICYCHIKKFVSISLTEIGGISNKEGIAEFGDGKDVAFESEDSAIML